MLQSAEIEVVRSAPGSTNESGAIKDEKEKRAAIAPAKYWKFHWEDGLYFQWIRQFTIGGTNRLFKTQTQEKVGLTGKLGGLLQADGAVYWPQTSTADFQDGMQLRRAQIYATGEFLLNRPVHYMVKFGYYNPDFVLYNFSFWFEDIPWVQTVKFGYFKVPMMLEGYGSSTDSLMMEAANPVGAFYPTSRTGLQIGGPTPSKRMTWNAGVFSVGQEVDGGGAPAKVHCD